MENINSLKSHLGRSRETHDGNIKGGCEEDTWVELRLWGWHVVGAWAVKMTRG